MRSLRISLVAVLGAVSLAAQEPPALPAWTLESAVAQALKASPDALVAQARVDSARALQEQAAAAGFPRLDLRATYLQTNNPMQAFGAILSQGTFDNSINFNSPGQVDALTAGLYARYALYTGGRVSSARAAARSSTEASVQDREAALNELTLAVVRAYHSIGQGREAVAALGSAVASFDENLRLGVLREEAGQLLRTERLNLEVQRSQTRQQLLAAQHQQRLAERQFAFLLGLPADAPVQLAPEDPTAHRLVAPVTFHPQRRPEFVALQRRVDAAERRVRVAKGARQPSVGVFAGVQTDTGWRRRGDGESWSAGVSAEVPLFDGHEIRGRVRAADADAAVAREQLRKLEWGLALEIEKARLNHELASAQVRVSTKEVEQADESARLSRERFAAGSLLSAELISVETRLTEARVRRSVNVAAEQIAIAELRRAAGLPIFESLPSLP